MMRLSAFLGALLQVESLALSARSYTPHNTVIIQSCGELPPGHDFKATPVLSGGGWPLWSDDQGPPPEGVREAQFRLDIAGHLREAGNAAYRQVRCSNNQHASRVQPPASCTDFLLGVFPLSTS